MGRNVSRLKDAFTGGFISGQKDSWGFFDKIWKDVINITKTEKAKVKRILAQLQEEFNFSYNICLSFVDNDQKTYNYHDGRKDGIRIAVGQVKKLLGDEDYKT